MKKFLLLTFMFMFALVPTYSQAEPKTKAETEALLKDFSIKLTMTAQGQGAYYFTQIVCGEGCYSEVQSERKHDILFADFAANKVYMLDVSEKEYMVDSLEPAEKAALHKFDLMLGSHLFLHVQDKGDEKFIKTGSEKVAGRDADVYTYKFNDETAATYWIDNEYGFTLKYIQTGRPSIHTEVTEFTTSGVTVKGLLNLDGYKLVEE